MINKVILVGNIGNDPQAGGNADSPLASFRMCTFEMYTRNGSPVQNTEWHNIVAFGDKARFVLDYVKTGKQVYVEGKLHTEEWTDAQGVKRWMTKIILQEIKLLGKKDE